MKIRFIGTRFQFQLPAILPRRPAPASRRKGCVWINGFVALFLTLGPYISAFAADSAVVLMYHRFGEGRYPDTNIRLDQFEGHIAALRDGGYAVLPLSEIIDTLKAKHPLPKRAVAITVDDGFRSVYDQAWPRLRAAGFPFTIFISTDPVDQAAPGFMSWEQIRTLRDNGVGIGAHTASHLHMADAPDAENQAGINRSNTRLREELDETPSLFSFPYGETTLQAKRIVRQAGYTAAFGQQSGAIYAGSDFFLLPRFALNEHYGSIERFRGIIQALPLPVEDVLPRSMIVGEKPPAIGFSIDPAAGDLDPLRCYPSAGGPAAIEILGRRVEVRLAGILPRGRSRLNCTLPGPQSRWYWHSLMFYRPDSTGG